VSREVTFQEDTSDTQFLQETIAKLSRGVASQLRNSGHHGRTITLKIRYANFATHTRSMTSPELAHTSDEVRSIALELLPKFNLMRKVRLVGVRVSKLKRME